MGRGDSFVFDYPPALSSKGLLHRLALWNVPVFQTIVLSFSSRASVDSRNISSTWLYLECVCALLSVSIWQFPAICLQFFAQICCVFFLSLSSVDIVSFFKSYECRMFNKIVFCPLEGGRGLGRRAAFCSLIPPDLTSGSGAADFCWHDVRMGCCGSEIVC